MASEPNPGFPMDGAVQIQPPDVAPEFAHAFPQSQSLVPPFPTQPEPLPGHLPSPDGAGFIDTMTVLDSASPMSPAKAPFMPGMVPPGSDFSAPGVIHTDMTVESLPPLPQSTRTTPEQQVSRVSPPVHATATSFPPNATSSLQDALDPAVIPARSRASTVSSPTPVVGPANTILPSYPNAAEASTLASASMMLKKIAEDASSGSIACLNQGSGAKPYIENIKHQLAEVFHLINGMTDVSLEDRSRPSALISPPATAGTIDTHFSDILLGITDSDASRKRCASSLQEERPVKALKSEPQDDVLPIDPTLNALCSPPSSRPPTPPFSFNPIKQPSSTFSFVPPSAPPMHIDQYMAPPPLTSAPPPLTSLPPPMPPFRSAVSEGAIHTTRHTHSLSAGSLSATMPPTVPNTFSPSGPNGTGVLGRMNRSGSVNGIGVKPFQAPYPTPASFHDMQPSWAMSGMPTPSSEPSYPGQMAANAPVLPAGVGVLKNRLPEGDDTDGEEEERSAELPVGHSSSGSDVPQEYRAEVDRIFFEFLNKICSNLEATDSKGEPIHQTLMAKKMQRLDESKDFRPFKFRIQAFTHAFLEELARQGYPEEKIPMKKVRNYLWRQHYILRFNEDGKKAKSKGNHIWNIEAKKAGDGKWEFRPFYRKLAGSPPSVAYCGLLWKWTARIWDPQASWHSIPVQYSSPALPKWLSWKDDVLSGIPPPDAQSCDITAIARFVLDGQEGQLTHTFRVNVHPASTSESSVSRLIRDLPRSVSDTMLAKTQPRAAPRPEDAKVQAVLHDVAQLVTEKAQIQLRNGGPMPELNKQRQVIEQTISAVGQVLNGPTPTPQTKRLAAAAGEVVAEAALMSVAPQVPQSYPIAIRSANVSDMVHHTEMALTAAVQYSGSDDTVTVVNHAKDLLVNSRATPSPQQNAIVPPPQPLSVGPP